MNGLLHGLCYNKLSNDLQLHDTSCTVITSRLHGNEHKGQLEVWFSVCQDIQTV